MSLATVSLAMIVKDEEKYLKECLDSVSKYVDEIIIVDTGSKDKTKKIAAKYTNKIFDFKWTNDFAAARNFSFSKVTKDWILWLDGDDVVKYGERIRPFLERVRSDIDALMVLYEYDYDKYGNPAVVHWKERLIRNNGKFEWRAKIHENLAPKADANVGRSEDFVISHQHKPERRDRSTTRNLQMLLDVLKEESKSGKEDPDPRTLFYLGNCFLDLGQWEDAIGMYTRYVKLSGWDEERCQAYYRLGMCFRQVEDYAQALNAGFLALKERPDFPDGYFCLAETYYHQKDWSKTILWAKKGLKQPLPDTLVVTNELEYKFRPLVYLGDALMNEGRFEEARTTYQEALKLAPKTAFLEKSVEQADSLIKDKEVIDSYAKIVHLLANKKELFRITPLLSSVPSDLTDNPYIVGVRKIFAPPRTAKENEVTIFCGQAWEEWTPDSIETGIGGSEESVIYLSKELVKIGYKVVVYGTPGAKFGDYEGVRYLNYWEFNEKDNFNIFISWRTPEIFSAKIRAKKKYVWLHDVPNPFAFTKERLKEIDRIIVLSKAHRNYLPDIPDEKFFISRNGINITDFNLGENLPQRLIYTSSYDRGLEHLVRMWPEIKKQVPEAQLHVFYGWHTFDAIHNGNPERMAWKSKMIELLKQEDITEHGRVGHKELAKEFSKSGIWAYPTNFEEISCISAMKAQTAGSVPVVVPVAALDETVQFGIKVKGNITLPTTKEAYIEAITSLMKDSSKQMEIREQMIPWAKEKFSWQSVAEAWKEDFENSISLPVATSR